MRPKKDKRGGGFIKGEQWEEKRENTRGDERKRGKKNLKEEIRVKKPKKKKDKHRRYC